MGCEIVKEGKTSRRCRNRIYRFQEVGCQLWATRDRQNDMRVKGMS